jgi:hypothetical protein
MNIPGSQKICTINVSENCTGEGPAVEFRGSYCKQCYKKYLSNYYLLNRDRLLEKAKARYIPSGNPRGRRAAIAPIAPIPPIAPIDAFGHIPL